MFETDRLVLRSYKDSDMDILIESMSDYRVQVLDSFGFVAPRTPKFAERFKGIVRPLFQKPLQDPRNKPFKTLDRPCLLSCHPRNQRYTRICRLYPPHGS